MSGPAQVVGLSTRGWTGMLAGRVCRGSRYRSPQGSWRDCLGSPWEALAVVAGVRGKPQKVSSAPANGVDWLMSCTVKRSHSPSRLHRYRDVDRMLRVGTMKAKSAV